MQWEADSKQQMFGLEFGNMGMEWNIGAALSDNRLQGHVIGLDEPRVEITLTRDF